MRARIADPSCPDPPIVSGVTIIALCGGGGIPALVVLDNNFNMLCCCYLLCCCVIVDMFSIKRSLTFCGVWFLTFTIVT